jgi:riboflavin biosynthesis pyrimidine reductase
MSARFDAFCRRKEAAARAAVIPGYTTTEVRAREGLVAIGSDWSRRLFGGDFYRSARPRQPAMPIVSLVFVRSRSGNTVTPDPSLLGGGATDLHLVYEGLSRVDADAVMAGSATARAKDLVFSVWHPELKALRRSLGRPEYPVQVVLTERGDLRFDDGLLFLEPAIPVVVVTGRAAAERVRRRVEGRSWIDVVDAGEPLSLVQGLRALHARGLAVVSCVGGPRTATSLLQQRLVTDLYLTTSAIEGGVPETPYYQGPPLPLELVVRKAGQGAEAGVVFEHFVVDTPAARDVSR